MMIKIFLMTFVSFVVTNIDDIFVLTMLYSLAENSKDHVRIVVGQVLGMMTTVIIAFLGAMVLNTIDMEHGFLLGIIPIAIGLKTLFEKEEGQKKVEVLSLLSIFLIALSDGGDNIGVYLPLFAQYSLSESLFATVVYVILMIGICHIAMRIGKLSNVQQFIRKYRRIIVPAVLIGMGIIILLEGAFF